MSPLRFIWLNLLLGLALGDLSAQDQADSLAIELADVVITGQYAPQSAQRAVHAVRTISAEKMARMAAVDLGDVLSNELNIRLAQDHILGQSLSLQGLSGENVKIMIDGVPIIGRQNGNLDLSQLNLLGIERVEIIEGPLSVNYGSNALAGTINLITQKQGQPGLQAQASAYAEQIGTVNLNALTSWRFGKNRLSLSLGRNFFDGWNEGEAPWPTFARRVADSSRWQAWKPRTQHFGRVQYHRELGRLRLGFRGEAFDEVILNRGLPRAPYQEVAFDDRYHTQRLDQSLSLDGAVGARHRVQVIAAYNHFVRRSHTFRKDLTTLEQSLISAAGEQDTSVFALAMSRGNLTSTRDHWLNYELGYEVSHETAVGQRIAQQRQSLGDYAVFATAEIQPTDWLTLRPGLRYGYNTAYRAPLTPSLNAKAQWDQWTLRASYARGFRAPSLKELYFYFVDINHNIVGNPELEAEYSHNVSANLRYQHLSAGGQLWQAELSSFYNDLRNQITLAELNSPEFTYVNVARFRSTGANVRLSWRSQRWQVNLGGSYLGLYNRLSVSEDLPAFSFTPEATANLQYTMPCTGTNLSVFYKYQGQLPGFRLDSEGNVAQQFIAPFHLTDLTLSQPLWQERLTLALGAKNLFDVTNVAAQLAGGAHSGASNSTPIATGRTLFVKLDLNLSSTP